jgi:hypothetical protein
VASYYKRKYTGYVEMISFIHKLLGIPNNKQTSETLQEIGIKPPPRQILLPMINTFTASSEMILLMALSALYLLAKWPFFLTK